MKKRADKLLSDCQKDLDKAAPAPYSKQSRREFGEVEVLYLVELPKKRFDVYKGDSTFADMKLIVRYETNRYSVTMDYENQSGQIRAFGDRIEIHHKQEMIDTHKRCYGKIQVIRETMHYIKRIRSNTGALDNARTFKGQTGG